jgi:hypothetical protein
VTSWSGVWLLLDGADLFEDLGVLGEAVGDLVVVDDLAVDGDREDAAVPLFEAGGDAELLLDRGLQTGGLGEVVSLPAVGDEDVHPLLLIDDLYQMIMSRAGAVK